MNGAGDHIFCFTLLFDLVLFYDFSLFFFVMRLPCFLCGCNSWLVWISIPPFHAKHPANEMCFVQRFVLFAQLTEDGLVLALVAKVASEALAEALGVVADAAARAVASLLVTVAEENIRSGWALLEGAVRSAEAKVAHAAHVFHRVPRSIVRLVRLNSELFLGVADAATGAVVRAHGALASNAVVVVEALALAALAVAQALVGALHLRVSIVGGRSHGNPGGGLGASAGGAVVLGEREVAVGAEVARALVVGAARAVAGATVLVN